MACLEAGLAPTTVNLAKQIGVSRVALWKLQRRWPSLEAWCDDVMRDANAHYWGAIERRMALIALGGSVQHAEQYCKMQSGFYTKGEPIGDGASPQTMEVKQVFLVPRPPDLPPIPGTEVRMYTPPLGAGADIPTVVVR